MCVPSNHIDRARTTPLRPPDRPPSGLRCHACFVRDNDWNEYFFNFYIVSLFGAVLRRLFSNGPIVSGTQQQRLGSFLLFFYFRFRIERPVIKRAHRPIMVIASNWE
jgi:hypothetical protein